jgi:D-sedoheptulose 7-phosphate isomerase
MNTLAFSTPARLFGNYSARLSAILQSFDWAPVERLAYDLLDCWQTGRQVFFAGNGGSGGNANHLANDFLYALSKTPGSGLRLAVLARKGDVLVALSGSGNSPNIVRALQEAKTIGMTSYAMLGYSGGNAKALADVPIHFAIDDMQISEDAQTIVGHMLMQWLYAQRGDIAAAKNKG